MALAWILTHGVVPIPGTRHVARVDENVRAADVLLSQEALRDLDHSFAPGAAAGTRYPQELEALTGR